MEGPYIESYDMATYDQSYFASTTNHTVLYPAFVIPKTAATAPPSSWNVVYWIKFASITDLTNAIAAGTGNGGIPSNVQIVAYDNESWAATPCSELGETGTAGSCTGTPNPTVIEQSMETFATDVKNANSSWKVMFTPAFDIYAGVPGNKYNNFISSGIAGTVAPYADYYHIQAQGLEANPNSSPLPSYVSVVSSLYSTIHTANSSTIVTAGLSNYDSSVSPGVSFTALQIETAVNDTTANVPGIAGYWPNDVYPPPTPAAGVTPEPNPGNSTWNQALQALASESPEP